MTPLTQTVTASKMVQVEAAPPLGRRAARDNQDSDWLRLQQGRDQDAWVPKVE
jgi:hypothetical protein